MIDAATFIKSWIYSRKWNVDEKLKVKLLRKVCVGCEMLASSWKAWKCSALSLSKRINAEYEKQSSEYELWDAGIFMENLMWNSDIILRLVSYIVCERLRELQSTRKSNKYVENLQIFQSNLWFVIKCNYPIWLLILQN